MFPVKPLTQLTAIAFLFGLSAGKAIASPSTEIKARLFSEIGFEYAALGSDRAVEVFDQAQQSIDAMTNRCYQANPVLRVGGGYWLLERPEGERLLAEAIEIAKAQERTGCSSSATSPTESLANRAREFAEAGHLDLAIEVSTRLGDPVSLAEFSTELAKAGETERADAVLDQAIDFLQQVEAPGQSEAAWWRTLILTVMGEQLLAAERPEAAQQVFDRALESVSEIEAPATEAAALNQAAFNQIHSTLRIATALADSGATQQAIELLNQTVPKIRALEARGESLEYLVISKVGLFVDAAIAYHKLDQPDQAIALLTEVRDLAPRRPQVLARVTEGYARIGEFEQALQIARSISSASERQMALRQIALTYVAAGNEAEAVKIAQSIDNPSAIYDSIVQHYLFRQQPDRALNFAQARQVTDMNSDLATAFLEAGQPDRALQIVQANNLEGFAPDIAQSFAENGQPDRAIALIREQWILPSFAGSFAENGQFDRALQIAESISNPEFKAQAFIAIAQAYSQDAPAQNAVQSWFSHLVEQVESMFGTSDRERAAEMLDRALEVTESITAADVPR
ncbi:hypothetical protein H6F67_12805 [Microcoleus sp. FACHB-1515]|uniref:tetratricopeptide repeat protein n=1 Tax=Cyanophyceae TaxID=3028117 RepID=UPI0016834DA1|nr:hypothetical protein [Microcoleus sp. FACHB-1515]MBD2090733.1 hypothetical protein [Microcoleus sp. FACHB-1515]